MNENLIDRYLLNLLSSEERKSFEVRLNTDKQLQKELIIQRELLGNIEEIGRFELKKELKEIHQSLNSDQKPSIIKYLIPRLAAASVLIGVLVISLWWINKPANPVDLFAQNFEPYEISLVQRSNEELSLKPLQDLYQEGNYIKAIPLFEKALENGNSNSSTLLLGLGISYLQTNNTEKAILKFEKIVANNDFNFVDEANWYIGLSHLNNGDLDNAKLHLSHLADDSSRDHHKEALKLLTQLED